MRLLRACRVLFSASVLAPVLGLEEDEEGSADV